MNIRRSIATRLALGYGALLVAVIIVASVVFYFGTIVTLDRGIEGKIVSISSRLVETYQSRPVEDLAREVERLLRDGIDSDTEVFLLVSPTGQRLAGNLSSWPNSATPMEQVVRREVIRDGKPSSAKLVVQSLPDGTRLLVGRDLSDLDAIRSLVWRALGVGAVVSLLFVIGGTLFLRKQIERRIGHIRRTALEIEAGDLTRRIPVASDDEFGRLNADINRMLDRIQHLMEGVRHVSNAIAHDMRTPLSKIRSKLDDALRHEATAANLSDAAQTAIEAIDELMIVFDKLLQIAEAESGMRTQSFEAVDLNGIARDTVELYDASAEERQVRLKTTSAAPVFVLADRNLVANALANLLDNAIKYAGPGTTVDVETRADADAAMMAVRDNGKGVPVHELSRVTERFYRLDQSRNLPGNGLGLSIVAAIATLHGGNLSLEDGSPGLIARITLPLAGRAVQKAGVALSQPASA